MAIRIEGPGSSGGATNVAGVDSRGRILVAALTETESNKATDAGNKYNINTGDIAITNATKLTTLYILNNGNNDIVIDSLIYNIGTSTSGTGDILLDVIRNPTAGDIITNTNVTQVQANTGGNFNFSSNNSSDVISYKGAQGEAVVTGGQTHILTRNPAVSGRIPISPGGGLRLGKGASLAINYTPPASNTNQIVQFAANIYVVAPL